ncbi:MAG: porin [Bradymonadia bacterium]
MHPAQACSLWISSLLLMAPGALASPVGDPPPLPVEVRLQPGKGLRVARPDGQMALQIGLRAQFLYSYVHAPDDDGGRSSSQSGQIRRARLSFVGHTFGKHNKFKAEFAISPRDIGMRGENPIINREAQPTRSPLLDWYLHLDHLRDLTVRIGQYKLPFSRQRVISSGKLQFVDRSIVNREFNIDRDIGFDLRSENFLGLDRLRYAVGLYTGEGHSSFAQSDFGMLYLARIEYLPFGMFDDYSESDLKHWHSPKLSLGLAYSHLAEGKGSRGILGAPFEDGGTIDNDTITADLMFKWRGWSVLWEGFARAGERNHGGALDEQGQLMEIAPTRDGLGWMIQAGYMITPQGLEVAGRYSEIHGDDESSLSDQREAGGAISYYFDGHPFKVQADYLRLYARKISEGTHQVRVQLQAAF